MRKVIVSLSVTVVSAAVVFGWAIISPNVATIGMWSICTVLWASKSVMDIRDYRAGKVKKVKGVAIPRFHHDLVKDSLDKTIIADLGGESMVEVTLFGICELMKPQFNGEPGALLTDGRTNIFYVRDANGALVALYVSWNDGDWFANISSIENPGWWLAGCRVFSR